MMQCSEKAFAACPTRHLCGSRSEATFADNSECAEFNRRVESAPITRADKIRAMNDEALAAFWAESCDSYCPSKPACRELLDDDEGLPDEWCVACALEWLRQPVKEGLL